MTVYIIIGIVAYIIGSIRCKRKGKWKCRNYKCIKNCWQKNSNSYTYM